MERILNAAPLSFKIDLFIIYALPHLLLLPIFALNSLARKKESIDNFGKIFQEMLGKWLDAPANFPPAALYILAGTSPTRIDNWAKKFRKEVRSSQDIISEAVQGPIALFNRNGIRGTLSEELW
jgi:hypothetical protein